MPVEIIGEVGTPGAMETMSSAAISFIVLASVFGGALAGMLLRGSLSQHHISPDSKETVKLAMALVSTMGALVLGLLVSSAKTFYDTQSAELNQMSADIVALDRLLAHYGPETKEARDQLRVAVMRNLDRMWPQERTRTSQEPVSDKLGESLLDEIQALSPKDDRQRSLGAQALNLAVGIGRVRWLMYEQSHASFSPTFLTVMVFWLVLVFVSFGLFAPRNVIAIASLFSAALAVSGAIYLILEMYMPFTGLIKISSAPLRSALAHLGR
jgi:hypothetical protein